MEELWQEASRDIDVEIETKDDISYLYSGFKILKSKENENIVIYNIRISDFYNEVKGELLDKFIKNGFKKTCDDLQITRDERRVDIANYYIAKAILNEDENKRKQLQEERLELLKKINNLKERYYA